MKKRRRREKERRILKLKTPGRIFGAGCLVPLVPGSGVGMDHCPEFFGGALRMK